MKEPSKFQESWINEGSKEGLRLVEDGIMFHLGCLYQMARWVLAWLVLCS